MFVVWGTPGRVGCKGTGGQSKARYFWACVASGVLKCSLCADLVCRVRHVWGLHAVAAGAMGRCVMEDVKKVVCRVLKLNYLFPSHCTFCRSPSHKAGMMRQLGFRGAAMPRRRYKIITCQGRGLPPMQRTLHAPCSLRCPGVSSGVGLGSRLGAHGFVWITGMQGATSAMLAEGC